jgi:thiamine biosynthesis protein ThiS
MKITVNGEEIEISTPLSIAGLTEKLEIDRRKVAIERNLEIVPKSLFDDTPIMDGDRIEIVQFVGGG